MSGSYDRSNPVLMTAGYLSGSLQAADALGGSLDDALSMSGLSRQQLLEGNDLIPLHSVVTFLNQAAADLRCDTFGLAVADHQAGESLSHIGKLVRFAPTLGRAIKDALRFNVLNSEYSDWRLTSAGGLAALERYTRVRYDGRLVQMQLLSVAVVHRALQALMQRDVELRQVCFSHARPARPARVEQFFGAPVVFAAPFDGLVFAERELDQPVPTADPDVHRLLCEQLQAMTAAHPLELDTITRLRHALRQEVGSKRCTLESVSRSWGIHPRRLQRRLKAQGSSFRTVLSGVRLELAQGYLLDSSISVVELADILGYRNASAFSRAFKANTGLAPEHWRRDNALAPPPATPRVAK